MNHFKLLALILIAAWSTIQCHSARADVSAADLQEAYKWFDTLGYPDIGKLPFVDVSWSYSVTDAHGRHYEHEHRFGFLLEDNKTSFRVFLPDLTEEVFEESRAGQIPHEHLKCKRIDTTEWMQRRMALAFSSDYRIADDGIGGELDRAAQMFVLARSIASRMGEQPAVNLFNHAVAVYGWRYGQDNRTLDNRLETSMSLASLRKAIGLFANASVTRASILSNMQLIVRRFPNSKWEATAQEYIGTLTPMVSEDRDYAASAAAFAKPPTGEDLVKDLIFRLRDQIGHQYVNPDTVHFLPFAGVGNGTTPAEQLVKLGELAVPLLISALDDHRYTRGVDYRMTSSEELGCHVTSLRDAALQILDRISGRTFEAQGNMIDDAHGTYVKADAQSWWNDFKKHGELAVLLKGVSRGDGESSAQAEILVKTVELYAYRDNDGSGFRVTMKVVPGKLDKSGHYSSWMYKKHVQVGDSKYLLCTDGGGGSNGIQVPHGAVANTYDDDGLVGAINTALAYPPLETILIDVRLTRTQ